MKRDDGSVTFEQLGITCLLVDEFHLFKNLGLPTNISSLAVTGSKRAADLEMKIRWLEKQSEGKPYAFGFTATPISNNMVEAYVCATYLRPDLLREWGMETVDAFASLYINFENAIEVAPDGVSFQMRERPARFVNLPEFRILVGEFADVRNDSMLDSRRPRKIERTVVLEPTPEINAWVKTLVRRAENIHNGGVDPHIDNMLAVTGDGRKGTVSLTLAGLSAEQEVKLEAAAGKMAEIYHEMQEKAARLPGKHKSLQVVFCDVGTPGPHKGDQAYGILKRLLVAQGIEPDAIRYIHDAKTDAAKAVLFEQCRSGEVAILMGSTEKMGTGTNVQLRCTAVHHVDAPYRPSDVIQRTGRGHRPGNIFTSVQVYTYVLKKTFDAFIWQILARKAGFFDKVINGSENDRELDDAGEVALSFGEIKAAATGDVLILDQAAQAMKITRLERLYNAHARARHRDRQNAGIERGNARVLLSRIETLQHLCTKFNDCERPGFTTSDRTFFGSIHTNEIGENIAKQINRMVKRNQTGQEWIGTFCDIALRVLIEADPHRKGRMNVYLILGDQNEDGGHVALEVNHEWMFKKNFHCFVEELANVIHTAEESMEKARIGAAEAEEHVRQYEEAANAPFPQADELKERSERKAALDALFYLEADAAAEPKADKKEAKENSARSFWKVRQSI